MDHGIEIPEGATDSNADWFCVECGAHSDNEGEDGVYAYRDMCAANVMIVTETLWWSESDIARKVVSLEE